ncbi:hypothetical protein Ancab_005341 [Ancistrocladus abbreviatus]
MEGTPSECQLVVDQVINARMMAKEELKVWVDIEKGKENCVLYKEAVYKATKMVIKADIKVGRDLSANYRKWRELLPIGELEKPHINCFVPDLKSFFFSCFSSNQSISKVASEGDGCPAPPTTNKSSSEDHDHEAKKSESSSSRPPIPFTYFPVGSRLSVL